MEISRLKTDQNISFQQARNIVLSNRAEIILGHPNDHTSQLNFRTNAHIGLGSFPPLPHRSTQMQRICNCQQLHEQKRNGSKNMTQQKSIHSQQQSNVQSTRNETQQRTNIMPPNQSVIYCHYELSQQSCITLSGGMQRSGNIYGPTNSPYYDSYQASQIPSTYASMVNSTRQTCMHEQSDI